MSKKSKKGAKHIVMFFVRVALVMVIWNYLITKIFDLIEINYWQATLMIVLYNLIVWKKARKR